MEPQGQTENVDFNQEVANSHIDMNPPQIVEPLTGSSVLVEPKPENNVPNNGFPIGYGPNEHLKKIEKPKKPKMSERLKHARKKWSKKQKILAITIPAVIVLAVGGFSVYATVTGMFKTDYSETYKKAKELRVEMQKLRSDSNCDKVIEYVNNQYTAMQVYQTYIEGCRTVGEGIASDIITAVGDTQGVLKDEEVRKRYEILDYAFNAAREGNSQVNGLLNKYSLWHSWVLAESSGNSAHNDWDWTEADLNNAAGILTNSGVKEFREYGEGWLKLKKEAAVSTNTYYHAALGTIGTLADTYNEMVTKQNTFNDWKKQNEPVITEVFPLELVDTANIYTKFEEFYNFIREVYQNNYNQQAGGCKEFVNSVVCD